MLAGCNSDKSVYDCSRMKLQVIAPLANKQAKEPASGVKM